MDRCELCGSAITEHYFRVGTKMSCGPCARIVAEEAGRDPTPFLLKGVVTAFLAACSASLLRAGFEALVGLAGNAGGVIGMFLRWFVLLFLSAVVIGGAKAGSKGRGGALLQIPSVLFFYLAVTLAVVPVIFLRTPRLPRSLPMISAVSFYLSQASLHGGSARSHQPHWPHRNLHLHGDRLGRHSRATQPGGWTIRIGQVRGGAKCLQAKGGFSSFTGLKKLNGTKPPA